jgi:crotonobetainyl-CoA:carnitine CoA-transferase CaiB-like acyl-CoA transferase
LDHAIAQWTLQHDIDEVIRRLEIAEVPVGRSFTAADIVQDEHYRERQMLEKHPLPRGGPDILIPGIVPKLSRTPGETRWLGPDVGQHTVEVLASLGLGLKAITRLKGKGII